MTGRRDPRGYVPMRVEGVALERDLQWQVGDELLPLAHRWRRRIYGLAVIEDHAENGLKDGYINTQGKIAITPQFDHAYDFNEGVAEVQVFDQGANNSHGLIDKSGRRVADLTRSPTSALPLCPPLLAGELQFSEGYAAAKRGSLGEGCFGPSWGFIDKSGQFVIEPRFAAASVAAAANISSTDRVPAMARELQHDIRRQDTLEHWEPRF